MTHILIVDDETAIADLVEVYLKNEGFAVHKFYQAKEALDCVESTPLDLAILDVMLPDMDGFTLCQKISGEITCFPSSCSRPRWRTWIRSWVSPWARTTTSPSPSTRWSWWLGSRLSCGAIPGTIQGAQGEEQEVPRVRLPGSANLQDQPQVHFVRSRSCALTPLEFSILWYLCEQRGQVVSSEELFEAVWGEKYFDSNNTVMCSHRPPARKDARAQPQSPSSSKPCGGWGTPLNSKISMRAKNDIP